MAFFLVKLLTDHGYDGSLHFDAHAYRSEDYNGVKDFARGCIRTYLILREKAQRFHADAEIQAALETAMVDRLAEPALPSVTPDAIAQMRRGPHDLDAMATRGYGLERLDQLVTELLLGTR